MAVEVRVAMEVRVAAMVREAAVGREVLVVQMAIQVQVVREAAVVPEVAALVEALMARAAVKVEAVQREGGSAPAGTWPMRGREWHFHSTFRIIWVDTAGLSFDTKSLSGCRIPDRNRSGNGATWWVSGRPSIFSRTSGFHGYLADPNAERTISI